MADAKQDKLTSLDLLRVTLVVLRHDHADHDGEAENGEVPRVLQVDCLHVRDGNATDHCHGAGQNATNQRIGDGRQNGADFGEDAKQYQKDAGDDQSAPTRDLSVEVKFKELAP